MPEVGSASGRTSLWRKASRLTKPVGVWIGGIAAAIVSTIIATSILTVRHHSDNTAAAPVTVAVTTNHSQASGWITTTPLAQAAKLPVLESDNRFDKWDADWTAWIEATHAVPAHDLTIILTVQGTSSTQVTLTGLTIRVLQRRPAIAGVNALILGGGDTPYRWISADLDAVPPKLAPGLNDAFVNSVPTQERRPLRFPYQVSISEAESLEIDAHTITCDCVFVIDLSWAAGGRTGMITADDKGHPFRITGPAAVTYNCTTLPIPGKRPECRAGRL